MPQGVTNKLPITEHVIGQCPLLGLVALMMSVRGGKAVLLVCR